MLITTTNTIEGKRIVAYKGVIAGEAIMGTTTPINNNKKGPTHNNRVLAFIGGR